MKCSRAQMWVQLYVDGRLDARRLAPLEEHLHECDGCRQQLTALELMSEALAERPAVAEPAWLTGRILARVAAFEASRTSAEGFSLRWGDALLAALLASISTLLFVLLDPGLRMGIPTMLTRDFPELMALLAKPGPGSIAWAAWIVWVCAGLGLAFWLAGTEVRSSWRRSIGQHLPQLRQP